MANRKKTERNQKILALWDGGKGWRQRSIARMFKMQEGAVQMVIARAKQKGQLPPEIASDDVQRLKNGH